MAIDATGLQTLEELLESMKRRRGTLLLSAVGPQPFAAMRRSGFLERLGEENVAADIFVALARAKEIIDLESTKADR
jgi:sulfate permease, SulP family